MDKVVETDILIIGAGLTGLSVAYYLKDTGKKILVVDSRDRLGGRIKTIGFEENKPLELGATWLGQQHTYLLKLMKQLGVKTFQQAIGQKAIYEAISTSPPYLASLPPNPEPTLRIKGGSMALISALANSLDAETIELNTKINKLSQTSEGLEAFAEAKKIKAQKVITTLPPNLLINHIEFEPALPSKLIQLAKNTQTWMGNSIKIALRYEKPFWRKDNLSGTIFSNVGPIPEMYDHSNFEDKAFALMGFFNGNYHSISKEERLEMVLSQLRKYFGQESDNYFSYHEEIWCHNKNTYHEHEEHVLPHQNHGHPLYQSTVYNDNLIIAGTETSSKFPGYMEGAVYSALTAIKKLEENYLA